MIGGIELDVLIGTGLYTLATAHTGVGGFEILRGYKETIEERTDDVALGPRKPSGDGVEPTSSVDYIVDNLIDTRDGIDEFLLLFLLWIDIEPRQADVGFGHLYGITQGAGPPFLSHIVAENLGGHACIVATGGNEVEVFNMLDLHLLDESLHERRNTPTIAGEDEPQTLTVFQLVVHLAPYLVGDETECVGHLPRV